MTKESEFNKDPLVLKKIFLEPNLSINAEQTKVGSSEIASLIRQKIISGKLNVLDRLPSERVLAKYYSVARGTIREALVKLEKEKLVQILAGSGTYILKLQENDKNQIISYARPLELIDARFALEPHICRLAVLHARQKDIDLAEETLKKMEFSANSIEEFSSYDETFHSIIAESTNNSLLISMFNQINSVRKKEQWTLMRKLTLNLQTIKLYNSQHKGIIQAIKARDPERAAYLMKEHLETARLSLTRASAT